MPTVPDIMRAIRTAARGPRAPRPPRRVTFYTRAGCHLCEHAEELLEDLQADYDLRVTAVDITADPALFERYRYDIPVVAVEGGAAVSGRIDRAGLRRALESTVSGNR